MNLLGVHGLHWMGQLAFYFSISGARCDGVSVTSTCGLIPAPQWKGQELFAASFDFIIQDMNHFYKRRLFPQISISKSMFSKWGKTYALLWLCFLICGPSYVRMRAFHGCIKAFCTDLGT